MDKNYHSITELYDLNDFDFMELIPMNSEPETKEEKEIETTGNEEEEKSMSEINHELEGRVRELQKYVSEMLPEIPREHNDGISPISKRPLSPRHGHWSDQGNRPDMEDQLVVEPSFIVPASKCTSDRLALYAVLDGHGGDQCAVFCARKLKGVLFNNLRACTDVETAMRKTVAELEARSMVVAKDYSGCTCCMVLIDKQTHDLWCCNVGDSRCILIDQMYDEVKQLSIEHKPEIELEKQRIEDAGGRVVSVAGIHRVNGVFSVSRAIGDKKFKQKHGNVFISTPDITHHKVNLDEDNTIVLACDGLFDVFTNSQCMHWMQQNDSPAMDTKELANKLCYEAIEERRSGDNVSVLIIHLDIWSADSPIGSSDTSSSQQNEENLDIDSESSMTDHSSERCRAKMFDLEQAMSKINRHIEELDDQVAALRAKVDEQDKEIKRLATENKEMKTKLSQKLSHQCAHQKNDQNQASESKPKVLRRSARIRKQRDQTTISGSTLAAPSRKKRKVVKNKVSKKKKSKKQ